MERFRSRPPTKQPYDELFEEAGIEFIDENGTGEGVRFRRPATRKAKVDLARRPPVNALEMRDRRPQGEDRTKIAKVETDICLDFALIPAGPSNERRRLVKDA